MMRTIRGAVAAALLGGFPGWAGAQDSISAESFAIHGPRASGLWTPAVPDTTRPRAIELSQGYYTRLSIHRIASYATLPLFAGEYLLGERLLDSDDPAGWIKPAHTGVALALGALFTVNTVTGAWNLWEARRVPAGRTRRIVHTVLMLAADAGFVYTASLAGNAKDSDAGADKHRNAAIVSIGVATVSTVMMWLWKG
jgi:hypothetical protein